MVAAIQAEMVLQSGYEALDADQQQLVDDEV